MSLFPWIFLPIYTVLCIEPEFDSYVTNVTAPAGTTAVLPCTINNRKIHQVVWSSPSSTILSHQDRRVTDDVRISVERPFVKDWNLHIRKVRVSDSGEYNCQINTNPVRTKTVNLHVVVPPSIIVHLSSNDMKVKEGDMITLICNVTGVPYPNVTWYRQSANNDYSTMERIGMQGEVLVIHNVSRYCEDVYECVANNGVPLPVSRRIKVSVDFAPEVRLRNKRIGQGRGRETILDCRITASPQGVTVWKRNGKELINTKKYSIEVFNEGGHTITLSLRIMNLSTLDFGEYTCVASNHLGSDQETMTLYDTTQTTVREQIIPFVVSTKLPVKIPIKNGPITDFHTYNNGYSVVDGQRQRSGVIDSSQVSLIEQRPLTPSLEPTAPSKSRAGSDSIRGIVNSAARLNRVVILTNALIWATFLTPYGCFYIF